MKKLIPVLIILVVALVAYQNFGSPRGGSDGPVTQKILTVVRTDTFANETFLGGDSLVNAKLLEFRVSNNSTTTDYSLEKSTLGLGPLNEFTPRNINHIKFINTDRGTVEGIDPHFTGNYSSTTLNFLIPAASQVRFEYRADLATSTLSSPLSLQISLIGINAKNAATGRPEPVWHEGEGGVLSQTEPVPSAIFKVVP